MAMSEYSLSDLAAVTDGNGFGGNNMFGYIFLFALLFGGFGNFGGRGNAATTEDLASGFNFSALQNKGNEILAAVNTEGRTTDNAICTLGYQTLEQSKNLSAQIADCCCTTQRAVDGVKFDMANYAAATNLAIVENTQKILDKMCADQTAALQARVNQLENAQAIQAATAGIPRINTDAWGVRMYPTCVPCGCNTCCTASM